MQPSNALLNGSGLIVEDDVDILEAMVEALDSYGMAVHTANNEAMALNLSNGHRSQETIDDYLLRGYCGLDAVKAISTFLPEVQVIMVSAHEDLVSVMKARVHANSGVIAVLKKPLSADRDARYIRIIPARKLQNFSPESSDRSASLCYEEGVI
jgi:DNA-binding NtrC family response regulator